MWNSPSEGEREPLSPAQVLLIRSAAEQRPLSLWLLARVLIPQRQSHQKNFVC